MSEQRVAVIHAQCGDGTDTDVHVSQCEAYCESQGLEVVAWYEEHGTGVELENATHEADKTGGALVVHDLAQLGKNMKRVLETGERLGRAELVSVKEGIDTTQPGGLSKLFSALAGLQGTSSTHRSQQAEGKRVSGIAPFGYAVDPGDSGKLVPVPAEQQGIERIKELHEQGHSFRAIARRLDVEGIACRGKRWRHGVVQRVLDRAQED